MKLGTKIALLSLFPMCIYLFTASNLIYEKWQVKNHADRIMANVKVLSEVTNTVGKLQVEKGKSLSFLAGGASLSDVEQQRSKVDFAIKDLKKIYYRSPRSWLFDIQNRGV